MTFMFIDPDILEATASEPLSLKEEYEMQELWKNDPTSMDIPAIL